MPPFIPANTHLESVIVPPVAAATTSTTFPVLVAPAGQPLFVHRVSVVAGAAITGANSNTKHVNVLDNATELTTLELVSGTNVASLTETALYAPATPRTLDAGDVLSVQVEQVGSGQALPPLFVTVEYSPK